ncbi:hypothetical protein U1Q18_012066 [Sarracenia purpurea var. burkii]
MNLNRRIWFILSKKKPQNPDLHRKAQIKKSHKHRSRVAEARHRGATAMKAQRREVSSAHAARLGGDGRSVVDLWRGRRGDAEETIGRSGIRLLRLATLSLSLRVAYFPLVCESAEFKLPPGMKMSLDLGSSTRAFSRSVQNVLAFEAAARLSPSAPSQVSRRGFGRPHSLSLPSSLWFGEGMADTRGSEAPPDVLLAAIAFWILAISQRPLPILLRPCSRKVRDRLGVTGGALNAARLGLSPSSDSREKRGSLPPGLLVRHDSGGEVALRVLGACGVARDGGTVASTVEQWDAQRRGEQCACSESDR